jgi:SCY1-like protein 1
VQVRHPNILALKDTLEVEDKGMTTLYIITEPVTPLAYILREVSIEGPARCCASALIRAAPLAHAWPASRQKPLTEGPLPGLARRHEYIAMGLYHIAKAVAFLNNDCGLVRYLCHHPAMQLASCM